jgi:hypothetical protein
VYLSELDVADVPPGVVTVISTVVPTVPLGDLTVIVVEFTTVRLVALFAPNLTTVAPVKLVPRMVTLVLPFLVPLVGLTEVTVGSAQ